MWLNTFGLPKDRHHLFIGQQFKKLTVTDLNKRAATIKKSLWKCLCSCGNEIILPGQRLVSGNTGSCGCLKLNLRNDLVGKKFGRLTVVKLAGIKETNYGSKTTLWLCKCDCGEEIIVINNSLIQNNTKSCGCLHHDMLSLPSGQASVNEVYNMYKNRYKNKKFELALSTFVDLIVKPCHYCGRTLGNERNRKENNGSFKYTGLDRIDSSRGYTEDNVVPCCLICNFMKRHHNIEDFLNQIKKIYEHCNLNNVQAH